MVEVLAPAQKMDGPAPLAGPNLVDLSNLDKKPAQQGTDKQVAAATPVPDTSVLTSLQLTDDSSKPAAVTGKVTENVTPAAVAQPTDTANPATAPAAKVADNQVSPADVPAAKIADAQVAPAAAADCDKSTACSFTPTTDREKSKPWWDARAQIVGTAPEKDANCLYKVQFGDDLSTIAQRQLHAEGKAVNRDSLKAEEDKLVKLNDAQYKSLDCNKHYLQAGWRLKLTDDCAAPAPAPAPVEQAPVAPVAPAQEPPCDKRDLAPLPPARVEAPLPPARVEAPLPPIDGRLPCDGPQIDGRYQDARHIYLQYGREVHFGRERPYRLEPGESIIYQNARGQEQLITGCNEDGSYPRHSHIRYQIDSYGRRYDLNLSEEQQQGYYQRLAPEYMPNYQGSFRNDGFPIQDRYSIQERHANEERRFRDDEARRLETERLAAERQHRLVQTVAPTAYQGQVRVAPESPQAAAERISKLPTEAERIKARTEAMHSIRTQQATDGQVRIDRNKQIELQQHTDQAKLLKAQEEAAKLREQQGKPAQHRTDAAPAIVAPRPQPEIAKPHPVARTQPEVAKPQPVATPKPAAVGAAARIGTMP